MRHPATLMPFDDLYGGLLAALEVKHVSRQSAHGLESFCYSNSCVYDRVWTPITTVARGIVVDPIARRIVALPLPKFFNVGERLDDTIPDLPFEVFDKLDGSLIVLFCHDGIWRTATKGSFNSPQAEWASHWIQGHQLWELDPTVTYLCEAIYPENRIVIAYDRREMVLLAAYRADGAELSHEDLMDVGANIGWSVVPRRSFASVSDLLAHTSTLPATEEGFVIRFQNGLRLKVKGEAYRRIHSMISRLSPISVWESMAISDQEADNMRRGLPEEFWSDFDAMRVILQHHANKLVRLVASEAQRVAGLSDKEVGLRLAAFHESVRPFIFPYRKNGGDILSGKTRLALFRAIRPTGNRLDGYLPSRQLARVVDEAA